MKRFENQILIAIAFVCGLQVATARADKLYATRGGAASGIDRANLNGSGLEPLIVSTGADEVRGIAMDLTNGKMYYTQAVTGGSNNKVRRANFDGTGQQDVILAGSTVVNHIALYDDKVYWSEPTVIRRANLDGTAPQTIINQSADGIAIATCLRKIYWVDTVGSDTVIRRANLDGTNVEPVLTVPGELSIGGFSISSAVGKMYWFSLDLDAPDPLRSANLDGTGLNIITTSSQIIMGTTVDEDAGKIYWSLIGSPEKIQRANLDGTGIEDVMPAPANSPFVALALDFGDPSTCPTVSTWGLLCLALLVGSAGTVLIRRRSSLGLLPAKCLLQA